MDGDERTIPFVANERVKEWAAALKLGCCTSVQLSDMPIVNRDLLVGDWLRVGDLGFIFASRGLGKTWFSMNLARGMADNSGVGPWKTHRPAKILYMDGEMAPFDIKARDHMLGHPSFNLTYLNHEILFQRTNKSMNLADADFQKATLELCLDQRFDVLFADNLSTLSFGMDENKSLDWEIILPWLLELRRNHVTVIFIHHAGRNNEMRGTSKREDPAFWIIRLDEQISEERRGASFISRFTKWRNTEGTPSPYSWNFFQIEPGEICVDYKECRAIDVFVYWVNSGLETCSDIATEMGVTKGFVSQLAKRAQVLGLITVTGRKYRLNENEEN